jgi:WD40 repeat protein
MRGVVHVWDVSPSGAEPKWVGSLLDPKQSVFDLGFSPDGRWLAITDGVDNLKRDVVRVYDAVSLQLAQVFSVPQDIPKAVAFSGDGRYLAVAGAAGSVWVWDTQTWTRLGSIAAHVDAWDHRQGAPDWQIGTLAWSAATGILATGGMDPLEMQDLKTGQPYTGPIKYTFKLWQPTGLENLSALSDGGPQR